MSKYLNKLSSIGDSSMSQIIQDNLIELFDYALVDAGGFYNVSIPTSGLYGGDKHKLRLVDDPRYTSGQVWEGFRSNWVWQSGFSGTNKEPKTLNNTVPDSVNYPNSSNYPGVSGIFVNGTFQPTSGVGAYKHHIDYPNGRVLFDSAIATTSTVTAEFSYKWVKVTTANEDFFREVQYRSQRADGDFTLVGSGDYSQLADTRLQLPAIAVEVVKSRNLEPYSLGSVTHYVNTDVLFHVLAEDAHTRDKLVDVVSLQDENNIELFDSDRIGRNDAFPLDYRGMVKKGAKDYPKLIEASGDGGFRSTVFASSSLTMNNPRVSISEAISPNLHHGVVRINTEVIN
tara:strand:- start:776 stop:1801 length:1026 start_codon:yes stop_codon:yes gene_type:complete